MENKKNSLWKKLLGIFGAALTICAITFSIVTVDNNGGTINLINVNSINNESTPDKNIDVPDSVPAQVKISQPSNDNTFNAETYIKSYLGAMTTAINNLNFSTVSDFLDSDSSAYAEQRSYIENDIQGIGLQEKLEDVQITSTTYPDENTVILHTRETYDITSNTLGHRITTLETEYTINVADGNGKIININNITEEGF